MPASIIACVDMHDHARCDQEYITNGSSILHTRLYLLYLRVKII